MKCMRFSRGVAGLALLAAIAIPASHAQFSHRFTAVRVFEQKAGGTGLEISGNLRGIAVNRNVGSPYYGYVYICDLTGMSAANPKSSVLIYKPSVGQGASATRYQDTGLRIIVETSTAAFSSVQGAHGVSVGPDDTVWVADFSERKIKSAPPVPTGGDTSVVATPRINLPDYDPQALSELPADAGWVVGNPRNLHVARTQTPSGPVDVILVASNTGDGASNDQTIQKYTWDGTTATYAWTYPIANLQDDPDINNAQNANGYNVTCDIAGNVYIPLRGKSGQTAIVKLDPAGDEVAFPVRPTVPFGPNSASREPNQPGIAYVQDPTVAGGGYLYVLGRDPGSGTRQYGGRYALDGSLLDAIGPGQTYDPLSGNVLGYMDADDTGHLYSRIGNTAANANFAKVFNAQPFVETAPAIAGVMSSPATSADGVTYFGDSNSMLYAIDDATGEAPAGAAFPVDLDMYAGGSILGRVAVRHLGDGWFIYFTTDNGRVGRIPISGDTSEEAGAWISAPLVSGTDIAVTPAVASVNGDSYVYVAMGDGTNPASLFRLDALTGANLTQQSLAPATSVQSSPSVVNNNIYVGTDAGTYRVLDSGGTFVVSTSAGLDTPGSPFVHLTGPNGPAMYVVDSSGTVFARNATNFAPIAAFDGDGEVALGATVRSSLFAWDNILYVGGMDNKVYAVKESDGSGAGPSGYVFFNAGADGSIAGGVTISPGGPSVNAADPGGSTVVFATTNGRLYQVRASDPSIYRAYTAALPAISVPAGEYPVPVALPTTPSADAAMDGPNGATPVQFVGDTDGRIYRIPGL